MTKSMDVEGGSAASCHCGEKRWEMDYRKMKFDDESKESRRFYASMETLKAHQVAVYVMCGGGLLGKMAAEQPSDFYIDGRVSRIPYPARAIYQAVLALVQEAEILGLDPHSLPSAPKFHNCGIF